MRPLTAEPLVIAVVCLLIGLVAGFTAGVLIT